MEEKTPIKTGIFGGSFNPIHMGHLALANYLCEWGGLDEIWFLVSPHNPLKEEADLWDDHLRLELVRLAIEDYPKFRASDFEFNLPRPSYTIHTLNALKTAYPEHDFTLLIGADNWERFPRWKASEEIIDRYKILIYPRPGYEVDVESLPNQVKLVETPLLEISSTFIRESLAAGKDIRYFLHPKVYQQIEKNKKTDK